MADDATRLDYVCVRCHPEEATGSLSLGMPWHCGDCGCRLVIIIREQPVVSSTPEPEAVPPPPYSERLARFLSRDVNDFDAARGTKQPSQMEFWTAGPIGPRHDPKPAWFIRMILERIHRLVRGM